MNSPHASSPAAVLAVIAAGVFQLLIPLYPGEAIELAVAPYGADRISWVRIARSSM